MPFIDCFLWGQNAIPTIQIALRLREGQTHQGKKSCEEEEEG